jgi:hypothetical protein
LASLDTGIVNGSIVLVLCHDSIRCSGQLPQELSWPRPSRRPIILIECRDVKPIRPLIRKPADRVFDAQPPLLWVKSRVI